MNEWENINILQNCDLKYFQMKDAILKNLMGDY